MSYVVCRDTVALTSNVWRHVRPKREFEGLSALWFNVFQM